MDYIKYMFSMYSQLTSSSICISTLSIQINDFLHEKQMSL